MPRSLRLDYNAPFTLTYALLCIVALVIALLSGGAANAGFFSIQHNPDWSHALTYIRLFTHVLGHANAEHLASNIFLILLLGPMLEEKYGWQTLLVTTLITAFVTGMAMALIFPGTLLGASGVVFAFIVLSSFSRAKSGTIPLTFLLVALLFLGQEIAASIAGSNEVGGHEIARFAHILGGLVGAVVGWVRTP
ncbi:MAG: rhomboid family intramembrane serine protease [Verrucomicrobiota bacterium JB022]|nr:rhomboid family intramembrane serine protease [Verrucomicrobiota bacterium JB022]